MRGVTKHPKWPPLQNTLLEYAQFAKIIHDISIYVYQPILLECLLPTMVLNSFLQVVLDEVLYINISYDVRDSKLLQV